MNLNQPMTIEKKIAALSTDWNADERETSILFDHFDNVVYLETTHPATARRWVELLADTPDVKFDRRTDSVKLTVPIAYCRKPELILMAKYRKSRRNAESESTDFFNARSTREGTHATA